MKAIIIGRHSPDFGDEEIEVIEQRSITWPTRADECAKVIQGLAAEAAQQDAKVLLQNTPGQVAAAISSLVGFYGPVIVPIVGVIVSIPGPRPGKVSRRFLSLYPEGTEEAILFANPRAQVSAGDVGDDGWGVVSVTVDGPPMPFTFSHIEWLY